MKEHIQRELTNDLRDIAIKYHAHQCLSEVISTRIQQAIEEQKEWDAKTVNTQGFGGEVDAPRS